LVAGSQPDKKMATLIKTIKKAFLVHFHDIVWILPKELVISNRSKHGNYKGQDFSQNPCPLYTFYPGQSWMF
jgi:hypothetical protein